MSTILKQLKPLQPLDLRNASTVGQIVYQERHCTFNAGNLGKVAATLFDEWIPAKEKATIVYDGSLSSPLGNLLYKMVKLGWFKTIMESRDVSADKKKMQNALIVGRLFPRLEEEVGNLAERAIYINADQYAREGQSSDRYMPDVVFGDPSLVIPTLYAAFEEWKGNRTSTITQFFKWLRTFGGVPADVVHTAEVFKEMVSDPDCYVFGTFTGPLTVGKMGLIICEMIERGMINMMLTTGALLAHGTIEGGLGLNHYENDPSFTDEQLRDERLNRVTNAVEPESNFTELMRHVQAVMEKYDDSRNLIKPSEFLRDMGEYLNRLHPKQRGILLSAFRKDIPILVPAFADSELANDWLAVMMMRLKEGSSWIEPACLLDSKETLIEAVANAKPERLGIVTWGGGVPRNHAQNRACAIEITNERLDEPIWPEMQLHYGSKTCADKYFLAHLGGCKYKENGSWGKTDMKHGCFAEAETDAFLVMPFQVQYVIEQTASEKHTIA